MIQNNTQQNTAQYKAKQFSGKISAIMFNEPESGYAIFKIRRDEDGKSITAKGTVPNPIVGAKITYEGKWERDPKRDTPYISITKAHVDYAGGGYESIIGLLSSDYIPGLGPKVAERIVLRFGEDTLNIIENEPERLQEVKGVGSKSAEKIHNAYLHIAKDQEVISMLIPYISIQKITAILKKFGSGKRALEEIQNNPYVLYQKFSGIGFATADRIALGACGLQRQDIRRVTAIVLYTLEYEAQMEGHSFIWLPNLLGCVAQTMRTVLHETAFPDDILRTGVKEAGRQHLLAVDKCKPTEGNEPMYCVYLKKNWFNECDITYLCMSIHTSWNAACGIVSAGHIEKAINTIQATDGIELDETQKYAVRTVFADDNANVTVITGGPGSGKTTIIKTIIKTWEIARGRSYYDEDILLCAPTGRASARMREATEHSASTIQSAYYSMSDCGCEAKIIVVDEFSMCSLETAHMVFKLASDGCKLVIVGDPDQLPAIGAGNVLRDLIESNQVNVCKLSSCHRNVGSIVTNALHINSGETTETFEIDGRFLLLKAAGQELRNSALNNYFAFVEKWGEQATEKGACNRDVFEEGVKQVCLLTPIKKQGSGNISATDLNLLIRDELNPATFENSSFIENFRRKAKPEKGFEFRIGDRVMLCKNHKNSFVNGDMGFITQYEEKAIDPDSGNTIHDAYTIRFDNPCDVEGNIYTMVVSRKTLQAEFSLAYAMTVHKSQGSEFKAVVIAFEKGWKKFLQRNLLYTAVTRAKVECRIIGDMDAVDSAIQTNDIEFRNTMLADRLKHFDFDKYYTIHTSKYDDGFNLDSEGDC